MNQGHSEGISHMSVNMNLMLGNVTQGENGTMISVNPSAYGCKCEKNCENGKYLKHCECIKSVADDLVVIFNEIKDTQ